MKYSHDLFIYYEINSMSLCYELEVRQEKNGLNVEETTELQNYVYRLI